MVYASALSNREGLHYRRDHDIGRMYKRTIDADTVLPVDEAKQVQYVCREVRNESRTLGLRHHELYFDTYQDAADFTASLDTKVCKHVGTMHICEGSFRINISSSGSPTPGLPSIREFCAEHPHVEFRVNHLSLRLTNEYLLLRMSAFALYQRRQMSLVARIVTLIE
jgi:hypothetical protein